MSMNKGRFKSNATNPRIPRPSTQLSVRHLKFDQFHLLHFSDSNWRTFLLSNLWSKYKLLSIHFNKSNTHTWPLVKSLEWTKQVAGGACVITLVVDIQFLIFPFFRIASWSSHKSKIFGWKGIFRTSLHLWAYGN